MRTVLVSPVLAMPLFWLCLCHNLFPVSGLCSDDQRSLLLQLKNNLTFTFQRSTKLKSWDPSNDCCRWIGVSCDKKGHVTALDLSGESITGGIDDSSSLFSLQYLQKLNLAENDFYSVIPSAFNRLENLTYLNLSYAGFVGQIPIEISQMTRLVTLDLSCFSFLTGHALKLENPNLRKLVQNLTSIRQLYLDGVSISAAGHEWSSALMSLHDLQEVRMSYCNLSGPLDPSLASLENLSVIFLDANNLSSEVPETFANLKFLTILSLSSCQLTGTFPQNIFNIVTLSIVDVSFNNNLQGFFPDFPPGSLQTLRVSNTSFSGAFPNSIGNMRNLTELDFSYCRFNGTLPNSLSNLTELIYLDLSYNNFTGRIPSFDMAKKLAYLDLSNNGLSGALLSSSHFEGQNNLVSINLRYNSISGIIPSTLFTLPQLQKIMLSHNHFGQLDEFTNVSSSKLIILDLSSNNLSGSFPSSICQLSRLSILILSSNKLNGTMHLNKLWDLRNLTTLDLSNNNLSVDVNVANTDPSYFPYIKSLRLASCNLKTFPGFLRNHSTIVSLDLSDNHIQGMVPNWIWKLQNLERLNISHNLLTHLEGPLKNLPSKLVGLDLHHNKIQGPLPVIPENALYLDFSSNKFNSVIPQDIGNYLPFTFFLSLSNNTLSGSIPDSLCNATYLQVLDLSNNNISGTIPSCLMAMNKNLGVLNLRKNILTGSVPNMFSAACSLRTLDLHNNKLDGKIPNSLSNCTSLEVLDLGNNKIMDLFPCLLKNISTLRVLVLRNNNFHGHIGCPKTTGTWHMLQIVDLAINNFTGKLPGNSFRRWEAMMSDENQAESKVKHIQYQFLQYGNQIYYRDSVTVTIKGQRMDLIKILTAFTSIDFSSNHFEGEIPNELFDFKSLFALNLSNNAFSGQIPQSIRNMKELESLDLSNNSLGGNIPTELGTLFFLSVLNLSFNDLVGKIPTGTQLQSFPASSFQGNDGLYGPPLTKELDPRQPRVVQEHETLVSTIEWNFISVEVGLIFGHGMIFGPLSFWKQWRIWYWKLINKILCWIFPQLYFEYATKRGQTYATLRWQH
ncbi:receptor-like protein 7 [Vigna unguiculata]|uniref:LRR receptor-like serine/threonine-protein kinase FLS2 n=1 Tax=Vigna unguiculata TaxID=3917 RepID=A0A4D6MQL5_VIGUN|nr:receptor-like protein 7 [Vigna unguiculata]QCE03348.1 LRR receptor-like serine/threonine-protein kinase FLS2 [Vigna unguiculata]